MLEYIHTASLGSRDELISSHHIKPESSVEGLLWWRVLRSARMHFLVRISVWNCKIKLCSEAYRRECEMDWSHHTSRCESRQRECENRIEWMSYLSYLTVRCREQVKHWYYPEKHGNWRTRPPCHRMVPVHCCWIVPLIDWYPCTVPGVLCLHRLEPVHCYMIMSLLDNYPCTAPVAWVPYTFIDCSRCTATGWFRYRFVSLHRLLKDSVLHRLVPAHCHRSPGHVHRLVSAHTLLPDVFSMGGWYPYMHYSRMSLVLEHQRVTPSLSRSAIPAALQPDQSAETEASPITLLLHKSFKPQVSLHAQYWSN